MYRAQGNPSQLSAKVLKIKKAKKNKNKKKLHVQAVQSLRQWDDYGLSSKSM